MSEEFILQDAPEFEVIPAGTKVEAIVVDAKVEDSFFWVDQNDHSKGKQKKVSFKFRIEDEDDGTFNGRIVFGETSTAFNNSSGCRLRNWVGEIFGVDDLPVGFKLDLADLIDMNVVIELDTYDKKAGGQGNKVVALQRVGGYASALSD